MKDLHLQDYLRYAFAGGMGIIAFSFTFPTAPSLLSPDYPVSSFTLVAAMSIVLGSVLYSFHRALVLPVLYRLSQLVLCAFRAQEFKWEMLRFYFPTKWEKVADTRRWRNRWNGHFSTSPLSEWAAQVHLLYTSALGILLAVQIGGVEFQAEKFMQDVSTWIAVFLAFAGFISEVRLNYTETYLPFLPDESPQDMDELTVRQP